MTGLVKSLKGVPLIGPWASRIGQVQAIMATPCSPTVEIWVLAFWTGIPNMVWSLYKPDPFDERKTEGPGHRHGTKKRKFRAMEHLLGEEPFPKKWGWARFKIAAELAERIGWYIMIFDAATSLAVHWTSMAYQWSGCRVPGAPSCQLRKEAHPNLTVAGHHLTNYFIEYASSQVFTDDTNITSLAGITPSPYVDITVSKPPPGWEPARKFAMQLEDNIYGPIASFNLDGDLNDGPQSFRHVARYWAPLQPQHVFSIKVTESDGYVSLDGHFGVNGYKDLGILGDP